MKDKNSAILCGIFCGNLTFSHECFGEKFYTAKIKVKRKSDEYDTIPIMVSEKLIDVSEELDGEMICVCGEYRSFYKKISEEKYSLILHLFADEFYISINRKKEFHNEIMLSGTVVSNGRLIKKTRRNLTYIIIAVNRNYGKSDYIPCICWGRYATLADSLEIGTHLKIVGRIQSRDYIKKLSDEYSEKRTAYEVSISQMEVIEGEECKDQVDNAE